MLFHITAFLLKLFLRPAEVEKERKYSLACQACYASFTPLCFSVDGLLGSEANFFFKWLATIHTVLLWVG